MSTIGEPVDTSGQLQHAAPRESMKLLVVTVNYRSAEHVVRAIDNVCRQLEEIGDAEMWIVDNCSPDGSVRALRDAIKARNLESRVRLLESPVNGGFGAGNNIAFRAALTLEEPPSYFYLLNPDANPEPGAIHSLLRFLECHPDVAIVGGRLLDAAGNLQCSTFRFLSLASELECHLRLGVVSKLLEHRAMHMVPPPVADGPVDWVSGASMMVRRSAIEDAGMFDEDYFLYFEEMDFCRRVRDRGHAICFVRDAAVFHESGASTGKTGADVPLPPYWFESRSRYIRKFHGPVSLRVFNALALICFSVHRARQFLMRRAMESPHYLRDFFRYNFLPRAR